MSAPQRPDLHARPLVVWMGVVIAAALGLGAIAGSGMPGLFVALLVIVSGGLFAVGYYRQGFVSKVGWTLGVAVLGLSIFATAKPVSLSTDDEDVPGARVDVGSTQYVTAYASRNFSETLSIDDVPRFNVMENQLGDVAHMEFLGTPQDYAGAIQFRFSLIGQHQLPVYVTRISVEVIDRQPPPSGTLVFLAREGSSENPRVAFDLDSGATDALAVNEDGTISDDRYLDFSQIALNYGEPVTIAAQAITRDCYCKFIVRIGISDGTTLSVRQSEKPWSVSAFAPKYNASYLLSTKYNSKLVACPWPSTGDFGVMDC